MDEIGIEIQKEVNTERDLLLQCLIDYILGTHLRVCSFGEGSTPPGYPRG